MLTERAQSETVGLVLVVGIVVLTVTAVGVVMLGSIDEPAGPRATADAATTPENLTVIHAGGEGVPTADLVVVVDGESDRVVVDLDAESVTGDGDDVFEAGERWTRSWSDLGLAVSEGDRVAVRVLHEPTGEALFDGTRVA